MFRNQSVTDHFTQETGIRLGLSRHQQNKMWSFLLLVLSLNTGRSASVDVQGCTGGWVDFTFRYPNPNTTYTNIEVETPREKFNLKEQNKWEKRPTGLFLYHNTPGKHVRMIVNQIRDKDFDDEDSEDEDFECKFNKEGEDKGVEFDLKKNERVCLEDLVQTTYRTEQTTIDCDHQGFNFICKENGFTCDTILRQTSDLRLVKTISNVSLQDAGVYWCGSESQTQGYRVSRRKIHLEVKVPSSTVSTISSTGQNTVTTASVSSTPTQTTPKPVSSSTVSTISSTAQDTVTTASVSSTLFTTQATPKPDLWRTFVTVTVVVVAVLLLAVFFSYKRFNRVNNTTENQQEHCYEEIEERPQKPGSGTALKTIYTTVTLPSELPTELPTEPLYFTLDHPTSAQTTSTEINPSTSSSDEKFTVNILYSTMDTPQQTANSQTTDRNIN